MTNRKLLNFFEDLCNLGHLRGVKLAYGIMINKKHIQPEVESLETGLKQYHTERIKLNEQFAEQEDGRAVRREGRYIISEALRAEYDEKINELKEKYKTELEEFDKLLSEKSEVSIHKIQVTDINPLCSVNQITKEPCDISEVEMEMLEPMLFELQELDKPDKYLAKKLEI